MCRDRTVSDHVLVYLRHQFNLPLSTILILDSGTDPTMWYFFFAFHFISLVFYVVVCRSLFVPLSFFFWPLHCLSFDLRLLIIPVVSSNLTFTMLMGSLTEKYVLSDCHKYQQDFTVGKVKLNSIGCVPNHNNPELSFYE